MIQETPQLDNFKRQLRDSLQRETANSRAVRFAAMPMCTTPAIKMKWFISSRPGKSNC